MFAQFYRLCDPSLKVKPSCKIKICQIGNLYFFQNCFSLLCSSKNSKVALDLLDIISQLRNNSYWLVKVEL